MPHVSDIQIRDPFVFMENGVYYLFGSTDRDIWKADGVGFDVYRSAGDLDNWEGPFEAFRPGADFWADRNFWAPEVYAYNGAYYLFATFKKDGLCRGTAVLRADSVMGPYAPWSDGPLTPPDWECLDGTLYVDEAGQPFMAFCHEWTQVGDGQICLMPLTPDLKAPAGEPALLFRSHDAPWSVALPSPPRAPGSYVTDGPNFYRAKNGALLMLWSAMGQHGYCIGVATSSSGRVQGPWTQSDTPLFDQDGGHGMLFTDRDGILRLAIHRPNKTPNERAVFLPVDETDGQLSILTS